MDAVWTQDREMHSKGVLMQNACNACAAPIVSLNPAEI